MTKKHDPIEDIHPKSMTSLYDKVSSLVKTQLWVKVLIGLFFGVFLGLILGPTFGLISLEKSIR